MYTRVIKKEFKKYASTCLPACYHKEVHSAFMAYDLSLNCGIKVNRYTFRGENSSIFIFASFSSGGLHLHKRISSKPILFNIGIV